MSDPKYPAIPSVRGIDKTVAKVLIPIKESIERLLGQVGDENGKAVLKSDLASSVSSAIDNGDISIPTVTNTVSTVSAGGGYDPATDSTTPPAPTGLQAQGAIKNIIIQWDDAGFLNYAYTEVWRNTANAFDGNETLIGTSQGSVFSDITATRGITYYYWVRFVSQHVPAITGPYNAGATAGVPAQLGQAGAGELAVGSIVAGDGVIGNLAVDDAKLAYAAVNDLKFDRSTGNRIQIQDADIDRATVNKLRVQTADIVDAAVGTAQIGLAQVDTFKLAGETVVVNSSAKLTSDLSLIPFPGITGGSTGWVDIVTGSFNLGAVGASPDSFFALTSQDLEIRISRAATIGFTATVTMRLAVGTNYITSDAQIQTIPNGQSGGMLFTFPNGLMDSVAITSTGQVVTKLQVKVDISGGASATYADALAPMFYFITSAKR